MRTFCMLLLLPLCLSLRAQDAELDPSIFDGTGREKAEAEASPEQAEPPEAEASGENEASPEGAGAAGEETAPLPEAGESPREIVLPPEAGENVPEKGGEEEEEAPGIPAGQGSGKSRAGETVESTEKIAPGQAVDFPWDM